MRGSVEERQMLDGTHCKLDPRDAVNLGTLGRSSGALPALPFAFRRRHISLGVLHDSGMRRSALGDWGVVDVHAGVRLMRRRDSHELRMSNYEVTASMIK